MRGAQKPIPAISLNAVTNAAGRLGVAQAKGERIVSEELHRLGWQEAGLASRRKRDPAKLATAARLRKETTLSVKETAARLDPSTPGSARVCLLAAMRTTTRGSATQGHLAIWKMPGRGLTLSAASPPVCLW
jgi:hypothetical protein